MKNDWLPKMQIRYARRNRAAKIQMLNELCEDCHYERKYAIKLLRGRLPVPSGRAIPGRNGSTRWWSRWCGRFG